jgi:hypothetical protein
LSTYVSGTVVPRPRWRNNPNRLSPTRALSEVLARAEDDAGTEHDEGQASVAVVLPGELLLPQLGEGIRVAPLWVRLERRVLVDERAPRHSGRSQDSERLTRMKRGSFASSEAWRMVRPNDRAGDLRGGRAQLRSGQVKN